MLDQHGAMREVEICFRLPAGTGALSTRFTQDSAVPDGEVRNSVLNAEAGKKTTIPAIYSAVSCACAGLATETSDWVPYGQKSALGTALRASVLAKFPPIRHAIAGFGRQCGRRRCSGRAYLLHVPARTAGAAHTGGTVRRAALRVGRHCASACACLADVLTVRCATRTAACGHSRPSPRQARVVAAAVCMQAAHARGSYAEQLRVPTSLQRTTARDSAAGSATRLVAARLGWRQRDSCRHAT
eukprot:IDg9691t1